MSKRHRKRSRRKRRRTAPGAAPGSIVVDPSASEPQIFAILYNPDEIQRMEVTDVEEIAPLRRKGGVLWLDVAGLGDAEAIREWAQSAVRIILQTGRCLLETL